MFVTFSPTAISDQLEAYAADAQSLEPSHVVGIATSTGSAELFEEILESMPADLGVAFVIYQQLSRSWVDMLLSRRTEMPIHRVRNGTRVEANGVYLLPPRQPFVFSSGKLMSAGDECELSTRPADCFLRSLANEMGPRAIAVLLSTDGSDGPEKIRALHQARGLVTFRSGFSELASSARAYRPKAGCLTTKEVATALLDCVRGVTNESDGSPIIRNY